MRSRVLTALHDAPGERIALCDEQRSLTYAGLRHAVDAESRWLRDAGVRRCAVLADNGAGWIIADLALLDGGVVHAPLPGWFTAGQVAHVLEDAGVDCILTDEPERIARDHVQFARAAATPHSRLTVFRREQPAQSAHIGADVVKVTYTSGSTGAPKGVCLTLSAIEQVARSLTLAIPLGLAKHLCVTPLATLLENIAGVYAPMLLGATCVAPATRAIGVSCGALDPAALLAAISRVAPNTLILPPELLRLLVAAARRGWRPPASLRFVAVGGATVSADLLDEAAAAGVPAWQGYGLSECTSVVCLNAPNAARRGSVGRALPHARVRIDEHGQILVRGATMSGYLRGEAQAPLEVATGDLGEIDADGYVYVRGRIKNMFITSMGRNVAPEWVEAELLRDPVIGQAIVCGEARPWPVALIHPARADVQSRHIDRALCAANVRLPDYAQVRRWAPLSQPLSFSDGLLTANGRPRRDLIAARYTSVIDALYETALAS